MNRNIPIRSRKLYMPLRHTKDHAYLATHATDHTATKTLQSRSHMCDDTYSSLRSTVDKIHKKIMSALQLLNINIYTGCGLY